LKEFDDDRGVLRWLTLGEAEARLPELIPVEGRAPTFPVEGRLPTAPVEGLVLAVGRVELPPQPRASLVPALGAPEERRRS